MTDTPPQAPGELLLAIQMRAAANRAAQINRRQTAAMVREIVKQQKEN